MTREFRFWRNVALVGAGHLLVLGGLARWSQKTRPPLGADVVWMEGGEANATEESAADEAEENLATDDPPVAAPEPSVATSAPNIVDVSTPTPAPRPSPKPTPKPTAKPTPKKSGKPASAKKSESKKPDAPRRSSVVVAGSNGSGNGQTGGAGNASENARYGSMLHDRFFGAWEQPTSVVSSGAKISVLVRIRIERDGRVADFSLVRPSGNVIVDQSVAAIAKRVPQVEPLPPALAGRSHYDVNINFELSAD